MDMPTDPISTQLNRYLDSLVPPRPAEMQAMEEHAQQSGFPIVGPASGQFCYLLARLMGARRVFEMGSGYGYSTAWFARAVQENGGGVVYHVVWNSELSQRARRHHSALGLDGVIEYRVSEAVRTLRETDGPFDIIFNDIDKDAYPSALPVIKEKLRVGGVMIVDNMLWHGRIFDVRDQSDDTRGVRDLTRRITSDPDWIVSLAPIRDGLLVAYKKG
jgi:predicted O-methyltransferase YrrM